MTLDERLKLASLIDHTLLKADATQADIERLCREATEHGFAAVCVNPTWVTLATAQLKSAAVAVCTVVGFPLGATTTEVKAHEASQAIDHGAREIDMVINIGALKSDQLNSVATELDQIVRLCHHRSATVKVIIEAALLTNDEKVSVCLAAQNAGADFVKTSTGFGPGGATIADVTLMRGVVGPAMGVKAAGGIRNLATIRAMITAGATRIGTSAGIAILDELLTHPSPM